MKYPAVWGRVCWIYLCSVLDTDNGTRRFHVLHTHVMFRLHPRFMNHLLLFKTTWLFYLSPSVIHRISKFFSVSINMRFIWFSQWTPLSGWYLKCRCSDLSWRRVLNFSMAFKLNSDVKGQIKSVLTFSSRSWDLPHPSPSDTTLLQLDFLDSGIRPLFTSFKSDWYLFITSFFP